MNQQEKIAVRTLYKILDRKIAMMDQGYEMDSQFDGGEFCGSYYHDMIERTYEDAFFLVAYKFHLGLEQIEKLAMEFRHEQRC